MFIQPVKIFKVRKQVAYWTWQVVSFYTNTLWDFSPSLTSENSKREIGSGHLSLYVITYEATFNLDGVGPVDNNPPRTSFTAFSNKK